MNEQMYAFTGADQYPAARFTRFLWWLATAEYHLIRNAQVDRNRYAIIGMTVLGTWVFATLAWTYFFYTSTLTWLTAIPLGLLMGTIILGIDRALIKGMRKTGRHTITAFMLRASLAICIGSFMAQPALLYLFNKEIKLQTSLDDEKRKQEKSARLQQLYASEKNMLLTEQKRILQELNASYSILQKDKNNFLSETDGTGGSGKPGIKDIAAAKKTEYEKSEQAYSALALKSQGMLDSIQNGLATIDKSVKVAEDDFSNHLNDGFLTRIEALKNLLASSSALQWRYYLIMLILVLIELMPIIAKQLLPTGTYDEIVRLTEKAEILIAQKNFEREMELKEHYNQSAFMHNKDSITAFFEAAKPPRETNENNNAITQEPGHSNSFHERWETMSRNIMSKAVY